MTRLGGDLPVLEFEAFGASVGCSVVCGALSVALPALVMPTATLAALALAGWVSLARRQGVLSRTILTAGTGLALGALAAATVFFLLAPAQVAPFRALALSTGLVPLLALERGHPARRSEERSKR